MAARRSMCWRALPISVTAKRSAKRSATFQRELYPGDYLKPVGEKLAQEHGAALLELDELEWLPEVRTVTVDAMMAIIREDLAALNVSHDVFFSERSLQTTNSDRVEEAIETLRSRGLIYKGVLPPPKGQLPDDWEDREQTFSAPPNSATTSIAR